MIPVELLGLLHGGKRPVQTLNLKHGDTVVDIGCGTGLNFPLLQEVVGSDGKIIGVDLTDAMLDVAKQRIIEHGWKNIELVQANATQYEFPANVGGIISTFALTFVPAPQIVIRNGSEVLLPQRKWVVLDMAWPLPLWTRYTLFFLVSYGITADVIQRRPWQTVWETMEQTLNEVKIQTFWKGFFYLASGMQRS